MGSQEGPPDGLTTPAEWQFNDIYGYTEPGGARLVHRAAGAELLVRGGRLVRGRAIARRSRRRAASSLGPVPFSGCASGIATTSTPPAPLIRWVARGCCRGLRGAASPRSRTRSPARGGRYLVTTA